MIESPVSGTPLDQESDEALVALVEQHRSFLWRYSSVSPLGDEVYQEVESCRACADDGLDEAEAHFPCAVRTTSLDLLVQRAKN